MARRALELKTIATGAAEPVGGNRLAVDAESVSTVKKGLLGSTTRAVRDRSTVTGVWQGRAEEVVDLVGLSVEAQRAVGAAGGDRPDEPFLVIAFDDGSFGDVHWALQGDAVEVASAAALLGEPATGLASSGSRSTDAAATTSAATATAANTPQRRALLAVGIAAAVVIAIAAAGIFLLADQVDGGTDGGSDDAPAMETPPSGDAVPAVEADDTLQQSAEEEPSVEGPFAQGGLPAIATQLQDELGYQPRFIRIVATDEFVVMSVRLPGRGTDVDTWAWRDGDLTGPQAERVPIPEQVAEQSFTRGDVRLAALPAVVRRAEAVPVQGNEVTSAVIQRLIPFEPGVVFLVNAGGPRESVQVRADSRGNVTEILR